MISKQKGDIAEHRTLYELLKRGYNVFKPVGDRLPYDLLMETENGFQRIQIKLAWPHDKGFVVDFRRHQTNRKEYKHTKYTKEDFDYLIAWMKEPDTFFVFPVSFVETCSSVKMLGPKSNKSDDYREAWHLII